MVASGLLKVWASFSATVVVASLLAAAAFASGAGAQEVGCKGQVVLDAGHGGTDTGRASSR